MELRIAAIADYASLSSDQKLNIMGVFANLSAFATPVTHPQMYLVFQIDFDSAEAGQKDVKIVLQDDDGHEIMRMGGPIAIGRPQPGRTATYSQVVQFTGVTFPHFGTYEFSILINDRVEGRVPLTVTQVQPPTPAAPGV
ncbi:MAG: hypothetical protein HZB53_19075 [Chloroflexi bacterium]|nr:hypothetical protein [Chloroflexota bacterium]